MHHICPYMCTPAIVCHHMTECVILMTRVTDTTDYVIHTIDYMTYTTIQLTMSYKYRCNLLHHTRHEKTREHSSSAHGFFLSNCGNYLPTLPL